MAWPADEDLGIRIRVYLGADPTADPGTWPAPTDLSSRLLRKPVSIRRGRNKGQRTLSAGGCTFWLDNTDGALTPLLPTSTYYPDWDLGVPVDVAVTNVGPSPPYTRFAGFVADVSARMVPGTNGVNISAVQVTLGGVWRRISQGAIVKSAMRRYYENVSPAPVEYWPLESGDERGTFTFQSGVEGGHDLLVLPSTAYGVVRPFAAAGGITPGPPGAASATDTSSGGFLGGVPTFNPSATKVRAEISFLADGYENTAPVFLHIRNPLTASDGNQSRIALGAQAPSGTWLVGVAWAGPGGTGDNYPATAMVLQDNAWHFVQLDLESANGGADTTYTVRVDGVVHVTGTATGYTWAAPIRLATNQLAVDLDRVAHFAAWIGTSLPTAADSYDAFLGHAGEQAHVRAERICAEEGIPYSGTATRSNECGPQPVADVTGVLQDLEAVDHGMLIEDFAFGLNYRASSQRENLDPSMTIDLSTYRTTAGTQADVLTPVRNDQRIRNEWTITSVAGTSATAKDEAHQAKRGRYNDSATVNVEEDITHILGEAQWRVHEGTFEGLRYQTIPLDLAANE